MSDERLTKNRSQCQSGRTHLWCQSRQEEYEQQSRRNCRKSFSPGIIRCRFCCCRMHGLSVRLFVAVRFDAPETTSGDVT